MSDIDQVRLLIADTTVPYHYTDAQIQAFLTLGGSVLMAAAYALKAWAAALSGAIDSEKIGDYAYTKKQVTNMLSLAANYEEQAASQPAFEISQMDLLGTGDIDA